MKPLNTLPVEEYLNKVRIASKSNQKNVIIDIKEAVMLADSLAVIMTRLAGDLDGRISNKPVESETIQIKMDGGNF